MRRNIVKFITGAAVAGSLLVCGPVLSYAEQQTGGQNVVDDAAASFAFDMDAEIQFIRDTYAYTNGHIEGYRRASGSAFPEVDTTQAIISYYDDQNVLVKQVSPREAGKELAVEAYYLNPALGRTSQWEFPENRLVFAFATDAEKQEYRVYFKDASVIRYIGPDHKVIDFPGGIDFLEFHTMGQELSGGDKLWPILCDVAPGWWMAFEGEGA